jgi:hypothetical protein
LGGFSADRIAASLRNYRQADVALAQKQRIAASVSAARSLPDRATAQAQDG